MILRIWSGRTPAEKADAYLNILRTMALSDYKGVDGCVGAWVTRRIEGDIAHFQTMSLWRSKEAISIFAGDPIEKARYYDFDPEYLLELEPTVQHLEVWDH